MLPQVSSAAADKTWARSAVFDRHPKILASASERDVFPTQVMEKRLTSSKERSMMRPLSGFIIAGAGAE